MALANRLWFLLPLIALAAVLAWLVLGRPLATLTASAPPVEELSVDSVRLTPGTMSFTLRADGSRPITVAQVQVDGAWRAFTASPSATIARLGSARIDVPYPWIEGEPVHVSFLTSTGIAFPHTIEVAVPTEDWGVTAAWQFVLIGILLGIVPVAIGLATYPALVNLGTAGLRFLLALTVGLLLYLLLDTMTEGLEIGARTLGRLRGTSVVWVAAALTTLVLLAAGRRSGKAPEGVALAGFIALGIGLHNFGEGLTVGAAIVSGAAALATFLVVGFVIHNVTEGIGIAAPLTTSARRPPLMVFVAWSALAGLPAIPGIFIGTAAVSPYWVAIAFGIGAGAILQVVIEVAALIVRRNGPGALVWPSSAGGLIAGLTLMYLTALFV